MRIFITGAAGRLGSRLNHLLSAKHQVTGVDSAELDITHYFAVQDVIAQHNPDLVIHAAAWTDVDGCARDPERAIHINGYGAQNVSVAATNVGAAVLYISSNEVFDGRIQRPYYEYDVPAPANPYGFSKMVGERAVVDTNIRHYIVRTSWLFAHGGKNFIHTILNAAAAGKPLRVVTDEVASPTYNNDLAEAIAKLVESGRFGVYHFTNQGVCSRYAFARYALDQAGYADLPITRISRHEWHRPSIPPLYTHLTNLAGAHIGIHLRPWQEAVSAFLETEGLLKV